MTIADAAATLGVSAETIRRWARRGQLVSRRDARGQMLVQVLPGSGRDTPAATRPGHGHRHAHPVDLRRQLAHVTGLLREVRRQRDQLEAQNAAQAHQLEQAAAERAALLERLRVAQEQLGAALGRTAGEDARRGGPKRQSAPGADEERA